MVDPVTAAALIAAGAIGYAITQDGKVVPISPAQLQDSEVPFAKKVEIDTSVAHANVEFNESGAQLFVKNPGTPTTTVYIRFNNKESELFELTALRKVKGPFGKFFITNEAGVGTLTLIVTKGFAFEFVESEILTAGQIDMALNDLSDVLAPSPDDSDVIKWSASAGAWVAAELLAAELPDHKTKHQDGGGDEISIEGLSGEPADVVNKSLFNANTILFATANDTPAPLTIAASRIVGRKATGAIGALSGAEALVVLGVTATAAELNALDGIGASVTELNYCTGVTSSIQNQIDAKLATATYNTHVAAADPHGGYVLESLFNANSMIYATSNNTPVVLAVAASRIVGRKDTGGIAALTAAEVLTMIGTASHAASHQDGGGDEISIAGLAGEPNETVNKTLFDGYTILAADSDNTPAALVIAASRMVGRKSSGGIVALAKADILTIINVADGADVTGSNAPQAHETSHRDGGTDEIIITNLEGTSIELAAHKLVKSANATLGHVIVEDASKIDINADGKLTLGTHASTHQDGGGDELLLTGMAGTDMPLTTPKINENIQMTATSTELNILDNATLTTAELNLLDLSAQSVIAGELLVGTGGGTAAWQKTGVILSSPDISGSVSAASALTMPTFVAGGIIDMNGVELILDADGDTSITADTDDRIDFKIGGVDGYRFGANAALTTKRYSTNIHAAKYHFHKYRGTEALPLKVENNDNIGQHIFWGYDGSADSMVATISVEVDGATGLTDTPGRIVFLVTPDGGNASVEAMRISQDKSTEFQGAVTGSSFEGGDFKFKNGYRLTESEELGLPVGVALVAPDGRVVEVFS